MTTLKEVYEAEGLNPPRFWVGLTEGPVPLSQRAETYLRPVTPMGTCRVCGRRLSLPGHVGLGRHPACWER